MSAPVLDAPDPELQMIQMKLFRGMPLSKNEQVRWANRLAVEKETARVGGTAKGSVVPQPTDARAVGRMETQQAQDYLQGRDDVLGRNQQVADPRAQIATPGTRRGGDGMPVTDNQPKMVAGRYNGGNLNEGANLPAGTIAMQGKDGLYKQWQGGGAGFSDQRYESLEAVGQKRPIQPPTPELTPQLAQSAREALPGQGRMGGRVANAPAAPATAPTTTLDQDKEYIRNAGYGDFVDRQQQGAPAPALYPNPVAAGAAEAWRGMGGMTPRILPPVGMPSPEAVAAAPNPQGSGMNDMLEEARRPATPAVRSAFTPMPQVGQPPHQLQAAASRYNPFEKRRVSVLPE
jgi:hypothetical protein